MSIKLKFEYDMDPCLLDSVILTGLEKESLNEVKASHKLEIPDMVDGMEVTVIDEYAFENLGIEELTLPGGIREIGTRAFAYNEISQVTLPGRMHRIGDGAFIENRLFSMEYPAGDLGCCICSTTKEVGVPKEWIITADDIIFETISDGISITGTRGPLLEKLENNDGILFLPDSIYGRNIVEIADCAFSGLRINKVRLPSYIKRIEGCCFVNNNLAELYIPRTIEFLSYPALFENDDPMIYFQKPPKEEKEPKSGLLW